MDVINAMFLSSMVGIIIAIPSFAAERTRRIKQLPLLMDVHACWGRVCTPQETYILSLFTHFLLTMFFGGIFMFLVLMGWRFHDFHLLSILEYVFYYWFFIGAVVLPIAKLGLFGRREGKHVWLELLLTFIFEGLGFWAALKLFPVFLPT